MVDVTLYLVCLSIAHLSLSRTERPSALGACRLTLDESFPASNDTSLIMCHLCIGGNDATKRAQIAFVERPFEQHIVGSHDLAAQILGGSRRLDRSSSDK